MAASGSPGPPRREGSPASPPPLAGPWRREGRKRSYLRTGPAAAAAAAEGPRGESRAAEQLRRGGGGGYRSALRPIVSLPRGSRRSRAREPGSSPARHLLPPLWKRPPPPRAAGPGTPPPRRRPRPPHGPPPTVAAAAAAAAILARPGRPPFPAARARRGRVPAVRGGALPGLRGARALPGILGQSGASVPRESREGGLGRTGESGPRAGFQALHKTTGLSWCPSDRSRDG
nr:uncharacterized protein LOC123281941 [Equus asinus]